MPKQYKPKLVSGAAMHRGIIRHYALPEDGSTYDGMRPSQIVHRPPIKYTLDMRSRQTVRHLSTALLAFATSGKHTEVEIEIALVNGDLLLIAGNKDKTTVELANHFINSSVDKTFKEMLQEALKTNLTGVKKGKFNRTSVRKHRHSVKLHNDILYNRRQRVPPAFRGIVDMKCRAAFVELDAVDGDENEFNQFLNGTSGKKIALVTSAGKKWHAEQKLTYLLCRGSVGVGIRRVQIYGSRRPCKGCHMTLTLAKEIGGINLEFNDFPGYYYGPTKSCCGALYKLLRNNGNITLANEARAQEIYLDSGATAHLTTSLDTSGNDIYVDNHDSDSDSEDEYDP